MSDDPLKLPEGLHIDPLPWYRIAVAPTTFVIVCIIAWWKPNTRTTACVIGGLFLALYGILQDQFSVRLCPEYFTVLHNPIPNLTNPTLLGIAWGIIASIGGGILMGFIAGFCATIGTKPELTTRELVKPMALTVCAIGIATTLTGVSAFHAAGVLNITLDPFLERAVPLERHRGLFAVACYHVTSYASAVVASIALCVWIGHERERRRLALHS
jgi:hypothetical protein